MGILSYIQYHQWHIATDRTQGKCYQLYIVLWITTTAEISELNF